MQIPDFPVSFEEEVAIRREVCHFIVEGKSEEVYCLSALEFVREAKEGQPTYTWNIINAGGAGYANLKKAIKDFHDTHKSEELHVWIDDDIKTRDEFSNTHIEERQVFNDADFIYTKHKFEDFFIMHQSRDILAEWGQNCEDFKQNIVNQPVNYVTYPFPRSVYMPKFNNFIQSHNIIYKKGKCVFFRHTTRDEIEETKRTISRLRKAQADDSIFCKCDFIPYIISLFKDAGILKPTE